LRKSSIALVLALFLFVVPAVSAAGTCIYEFYVQGCPHCANLKEFLTDMGDEYDIDVHYIDANQEPELFAKLLRLYDVPMERWGRVPAAFIADHYCIGDTPCITTIEEKIKQYPGAACPGEEDHVVPIPSADGIDLTLAGVTGLALVDAINPCALAVLVILLSTILLRDPSHKKKALNSGLAFSIAVFLCYFLMGALL